MKSTLQERGIDAASASNIVSTRLGSGITAARRMRQVGFTLIELLVVIAIIGILSALVVGAAKRAAEKRKISRVEAEKHKLITIIDLYHDKLGNYPPDNGLTAKVYDPDRNYAATNPLLYELTGPTYISDKNDPNYNSYRTFDNSYTSSNDYFTAFNREGVFNSIEPRSFYTPLPTANAYQGGFVPNAASAKALMVPVDLNGNLANTWRYDSSSTNRHNSDSYDLWAVYTVGSKTMSNVNW
jgi:prepilin-type N-terminal cleavage/methylation domain-containing protein